jgi:N utilization substance protein A
MTEVTFDNTLLGYIRIFEERTGARVKDCLEAEEKLVYVVHAGEVHKAVGPHGAVVERLKALLKREIQVVEWSEDAETFVRNLFFPYNPQKVEFSPKGAGRHASVTVDPKFKARAIGKQGKNLKIARAILLRHSDVVSVNVA